jgi:sugar phosphate isomerase/epimerase
MPKPISVQLYTLREMAVKDFVATLKAVADIGFPYVEFAGLHGRTAKEIRKVIDDLGLKASSAHVPLFDNTKHAQILEDANVLGYTHLVGGFGAKDFESEDTVKAAAVKVNEAVNLFSPKDLTVNLHNHEWEYKAYDKFQLLLELAPKAGPQVDIYWVKVGGQDPAEAIRRYSGRVRTIHVKDGPANPADRALPMTAAGQGAIDIPSAIRAAEYAGVEFVTVEIDKCATDMLQAVKESYEFLTRRGLAQGKR